MFGLDTSSFAAGARFLENDKISLLGRDICSDKFLYNTPASLLLSINFRNWNNRFWNCFVYIFLFFILIITAPILKNIL